MNTQKLAVLITLLLFSIQGFSQDSIKEYNGFFNFTYDETKDKITLEVSKLDTEFLYVNSLANWNR